jgi:hypothetical protein
MNIIFKNILLLACTALLFSCLQGPWDYTPPPLEPAYQGLWVSAHLWAQRPVEDVCIDRSYTLEEQSTRAFSFYDSARVVITGPYEGSIRTIALEPHPTRPNCFISDSTQLPVKGGAYALDATIYWDSAGTRISTKITAETKIPNFFEISDTARAPFWAFNPPDSVLGGNSANLATQFPPQALADLANRFGDTLTQFISDTTGLATFLRANNQEINQILNSYTFPYANGDTVFYISATGFGSTLSHFYSSRRSDDVKGVLITHRFDPTAGRPESGFDAFAIGADTGTFYVPGSIQRILFYNDAQSSSESENPFSLLDSNMGVVNAQFFSGQNVLYFYGLNNDYTRYHITQIDQGSDSRVIREFNTLGARGFFAGGIVDSFIVNIKTPPSTIVYPLPRALDIRCEREGWFTTEQCRVRYRSYCRETDFAKTSCLKALYAEAADSTWNTDSLWNVTDLDGLSKDSVASLGARYYCPLIGFATTHAPCAQFYNECLLPGEANECKENIWLHCEDLLWQSDFCSLAMVSKCSDQSKINPILCREAQNFCSTRKENPICQAAF